MGAIFMTALAKNPQHLFCFGFGFCAKAVSKILPPDWQLTVTVRTAEQAQILHEGKNSGNIKTVMLDGTALPDNVFTGVTHILLSAPPLVPPSTPPQSTPPLAPPLKSDPILHAFGAQLTAHAKQNPTALKWVGYLSTTGVYGDHQGAWIDEDTPIGQVGARGQNRIDAEAGWAQTGLPMHYFRLAGIYGAYRNGLTTLKHGRARRINKPAQVFSRIHVDDIARILLASMHQPNAGRAYSVCDDCPAPPQDVVRFAADLLGVDPPPLIDFCDAELSEMARSFYSDNKRIRNDRIKTELGVRLLYPDYKAGLTALYKAGDY